MIDTLSASTSSKLKELYWIVEHEELCWAPGEIYSKTPQQIICKCTEDNEYYELDTVTATAVHPSCLQGVGDLL
jgi:hypothetical protein